MILSTNFNCIYYVLPGESILGHDFVHLHGGVNDGGWVKFIDGKYYGFFHTDQRAADYKIKLPPLDELKAAYLGSSVSRVYDTAGNEMYDVSYEQFILRYVRVNNRWCNEFIHIPKLGIRINSTTKLFTEGVNLGKYE